MLRWLPVRNPQELVQVTFAAPANRGPPATSFSYAIVRALAEQREIFAGVAGFSGFSFDVGAPGVGQSRARRARHRRLLRDARPDPGRSAACSRREDDEPGAPLVAVISYGYWERQFARQRRRDRADAPDQRRPGHDRRRQPSRVRRRQRRLDRRHHDGGGRRLPQVIPSAAPLLGPGNFWLRVLARPRPGVSIQQATARLNAVWPQIADAVDRAALASRRGGRPWPSSVFQLSSGGTGWTYLRERSTASRCSC